MTKVLKLPALEVHQSPGRTLYTFAVDGKLVHSFASVSRIRRSDDDLLGYQRPEVVGHIAEIRKYLESESPMVPNAVVLAFDTRVRFEPRESSDGTGVRVGHLLIPVPEEGDESQRPGFIVDGQQRLAAIREAEIGSFAICVSAFITDDVRAQTEQFILVNSAKPLPKGLIYELLPGTDAQLPTVLHRRRLPAHLLTRMNRDDGSPMRGLIQTVTNPGGHIKDNSILKMLENSLTDGVLYRLRDEANEPDVETMLGVLYSYWRAVAKTFPSAWAKPPKKSRLMHGAGIVSMGFLMDAIAERYRSKGVPKEAMFAQDLSAIQELFRWTDGVWDLGPGCVRKWNEVQNTSKDVQLLANYILSNYKARCWSSGTSTTRGMTLL